MASVSANQGWKDYWKEDRTASCLPQSEETAVEIGNQWIDLLAGLPDGTRVLDVATGNGVLLGYAAVAAENNGNRFSLTGVDLAEIDPLHYVSNLPAGLQDATFIGGTPAERLPFRDAEFDVVVSQYGLEYADLDRALGEVERVLDSGGRLIWLAHSDDSEVVRQNRDQSEQVKYLLAAGSPLVEMDRFVARIKKRKNPEYAAQRLTAALAEAEGYCRTNPPSNVIREVCTVLAETARNWQAYRPVDLERMCNDSRKRLLAHRQRINDLLAAVLSPARIHAIRSRLQRPEWEDLSITTMRTGASASTIGLLITACRALS